MENRKIENFEYDEFSGDKQAEFDQLAFLSSLLGQEATNQISLTTAYEEQPTGLEFPIEDDGNGIPSYEEELPANQLNFDIFSALANSPLNNTYLPEQQNQAVIPEQKQEHKPPESEFAALESFLFDSDPAELKIPEPSLVTSQSVDVFLPNSPQTLLSRHSLINSNASVVNQANVSQTISYKYSTQTDSQGEKIITVFLNKDKVKEIEEHIIKNIKTLLGLEIKFNIDKNNKLIFILGSKCPLKGKEEIESFLCSALKVDQHQVRVSSRLLYEGMVNHEGFNLLLPFTVDQFSKGKVLTIKVDENYKKIISDNTSVDQYYKKISDKMYSRLAFFDNYGRLECDKPFIKIVLDESSPLTSKSQFEEFIKNLTVPKLLRPVFSAYKKAFSFLVKNVNAPTTISNSNSSYDGKDDTERATKRKKL